MSFVTIRVLPRGSPPTHSQAPAARAVLARIRNRALPPFRYLDKGQMATIGRRRAVVQAGAFKLTGVIAWTAWLFVHIFYLVGFKNRIAVMAQWTWSYLFSKRGSRLITRSNWRLR